MPAPVLMESLLDRIAAKYATVRQVVPATSTTEVQPETDRDAEDQLPLGFDQGAWSYYTKLTKALRARRDLYEAYDEMDEEMPEFSSALNIYADNSTRGDSDGSVRLTIKAEDPKVQAVLTELRDTLGIERMLWPLARDVSKYGARALEVIVDKQFNVVRLKPLPTAFIVPQLDEWGNQKSPAYKQVDSKGDTVAEFEEWQILYVANTSSLSDFLGRGVGRAALRPWKQLRMMEDAVVIGRLTRAHNRLAYLVDTGAMTPAEAQKHINKVKAHLAKRRTIDPKTGKQDLSFNPLEVEQDIFVATNKESKADVKVLQGDLTVGNLADLEYFQQKAFTAFQVPKPYLAHEKDSRSKSVVTAQDIQFARSVRRLQQVMADAFKKLFDFALLLKGINPKKVTYTIGFPVISIVDDLRVWQTEQLKMLVVQMMKQTLWPSDEWVLTHLLGYDRDEAALLLKDQKKPDAFNGLYQAPKVGATASNAKVGSGSEAAADFRAVLATLDDETRATVEDAIAATRTLADWSLAAA